MTYSTPMRWPDAWTDPSLLSVLKGTSVDCLLVPGNAAPIAEAARRQGVAVIDPATPPQDVTVVEGEWPGVRLTEPGSGADASSGPTGVPWVDSNAWKARLEEALRPGKQVWIDSTPKTPRLSADSYVMGVADAGSIGASWILKLDPQLAAGVAAGQPKALETWKSVTVAAAFFAAHKAWRAYATEAVIGLVSSFSGDNEFFSGEILNLVTRTNMQYRILPKGKLTANSFSRLKAVLYADAEPPAPETRKLLVAFAEAGGLLIAGPKWGPAGGAPAAGSQHPRYDVRIAGKGRVAVAQGGAFDDPYLAANDAVVLLSHRFDLIRFWNGGAVGSFYTVAPDRRRAVAHLLFYGGSRGAQSVKVVGAFRKATLWTLDQTGPQSVETEVQKDGLELHLPAIGVYAAAELEA